MRATLPLLICCALTTPSAWPAVRKVPQHYPTITAAVTAASNGDVIKIGKGRYQEVVVTNRSLTFQGSKGTIWDGYFAASHHDQLDATADDVAVTGIEFQNGGTPVTITGASASVAHCVFRSCYDGVYVDGETAVVAHNLFSSIQGSSFAVMIAGPGAAVDGNEVMDGYAPWIEVDAEGAGGASVTNNVMNTNFYFARIAVSNAAAPLVKKNKVTNSYADDAVIDIDNCDDAVVSGNTLSNINYSVRHGIYVSGDRALVTKNSLEMLNRYSGDMSCVFVTGSAATVTKNKVQNCGAGEGWDTWGISVAGSGALVEKNLVEDLGGGGNYAYAIQADGDDARVARNTVRNINDEYATGILIRGDRATARKNKVSKVMYNPPLMLEGDDFLIENNTLKDGAAYSNGIYVDGGATAPGAAVIRGNTIRALANCGMFLYCDGVVIEDNSLKHVADCGIWLYGDGNVLEGNKLSHTGNDAFRAYGANNTLRNCSAKASGRDGYDVSGNLTILDACKATDCAAEGLDNKGTNTTATNCTLKGSRIDYAGNGGMANDAGTTYQTGGPGTAPEID